LRDLQGATVDVFLPRSSSPRRRGPIQVAGWRAVGPKHSGRFYICLNVERTSPLAWMGSRLRGGDGVVELVPRVRMLGLISQRTTTDVAMIAFPQFYDENQTAFHVTTMTTE
jgi:hypothetical protein